MSCPPPIDEIHPHDEAGASSLRAYEDHAQQCSRCGARLIELRRQDQILAELVADPDEEPGECPEPEAILDWLAGERHGLASQALQLHLTQCESCRGELLMAHQLQVGTYTIQRISDRLSVLEDESYDEDELAPVIRFPWPQLMVAAAAIALVVGLSLSATQQLNGTGTESAQQGGQGQGGTTPDGRTPDGSGTSPDGTPRRIGGSLSDLPGGASTPAMAGETGDSSTESGDSSTEGGRDAAGQVIDGRRPEGSGATGGSTTTGRRDGGQTGPAGSPDGADTRPDGAGASDPLSRFRTPLTGDQGGRPESEQTPEILHEGDEIPASDGDAVEMAGDETQPGEAGDAGEATDPAETGETGTGETTPAPTPTPTESPGAEPVEEPAPPAGDYRYALMATRDPDGYAYQPYLTGNTEVGGYAAVIATVDPMTVLVASAPDDVHLVLSGASQAEAQLPGVTSAAYAGEVIMAGTVGGTVYQRLAAGDWQASWESGRASVFVRELGGVLYAVAGGGADAQVATFDAANTTWNVVATLGTQAAPSALSLHADALWAGFQAEASGRATVYAGAGAEWDALPELPVEPAQMERQEITALHAHGGHLFATVGSFDTTSGDPSGDGQLLVLQGAGFELVATFKFDAPLAMASQDATLYLGTQKGKLYYLDSTKRGQGQGSQGQGQGNGQGNGQGQGQGQGNGQGNAPTIGKLKVYEEPNLPPNQGVHSLFASGDALLVGVKGLYGAEVVLRTAN